MGIISNIAVILANEKPVNFNVENIPKRVKH